MNDNSAFDCFNLEKIETMSMEKIEMESSVFFFNFSFACLEESDILNHMLCHRNLQTHTYTRLIEL